MTSASRFTFDVVANDKASETTQKITASIQALVPALEAAAAAYERMAASQAKLGVRSSTQSNVGAQAQKDANAVEKANNQAAKSAEASAKATFSAITQRSNAIQAANQREAEGLRQLADLRARNESVVNRTSALAISDTGARMAALQAEITRTRELQATKLQAVQAAQAQVAATRQTVPGSALGGTGVGASGEISARAAAAAVQNLKQAQQSLAGSSGDVARAEATMAAEINKANASVGSSTAQFKSNEVQLNSARYALYQVSAGYSAMATAAGNAVKDVVQVSIGFESAFAQVSRTTDLGAQIRDGSTVAIAELQNIKDGLMAVSTAIPTTFNDLASVASLGAQLGIASTDIVGFAETVTKFAATTDVTAQSTAQYFGRLQNLLDIPATKFENLGSAVAQLGTDSVATESEILAVTTQIAAVGTNAGFSAPYIIGLGTAMASLRLAPEISRGATTRIFADMSRAASEGGKSLDAYANVMGLTSQATADLFKQSPDQFFTTFITALGKAAAGGQNLTSVLDTLGIKRTQDINVITRLANGYQLLGKYTTEAASSFASGTYLSRSFQTIAETTQSSLTKMAAAFQLFENGVGQAFLGPLKIVADILNALFVQLSHIPAVVTAGVAGFIGAVAIFFAFKSAMTLVTAGLLAFRAATRAMGAEGLTLRGALALLNTEVVVQAKSSNTAAAAMGRHAVATSELAAATAAATAPAGVLAAELEAETLAAGTGAAAMQANAVATVETEVAQTGAIVTTSGLSAAFKSLWLSIGPVGWAFLAIGTLAGVLGALWASFKKNASAADDAAAAQKALNDSWLQAGDGAAALGDAVRKDTDAFNSAGAAGASASGAYETITKSIQTMADGSHNVVTTITDLRTGLQTISNPLNDGAVQFDSFGKAMADATGNTDPAKAGVQAVTGAVETQTQVLGTNVQAWKAKALSDKLGGLFDDPSVRNAANALGGTTAITDALKKGLSGGPTAIRDAFKKNTDELQTQIAALQTKIKEATANAARQGDDPLGLFTKSDPGIQKMQTDLKALQDQWTLIGGLQQKFAEVDTAIASGATGDAWKAAIKGALGDVTNEIDTTTTAADKLAAAIKDAQDKYTGFMDAIFNSTNLTGALQKSFEDLGTSLANNGTDFSNFTDAGRANLQALQDAVNAFGAIQKDNIDKNQITAEQAAANTSAFIQQTMDQLSKMGVDTSQLDFLQQYLHGLTGNSYVVQVGANVAPAVANLNYLQGVINSLAAGANSVINAIANVTGIKAQAVPTFKAPAAIEAPNAGILAASAANARAIQQAKNLADAQKKSEKAAKSAGTAAKNAADDAAAAIKKQQEYVNALAGYYDNLGSKIFQAINSEGDAFKSLQSLGQALVDNGKSFDNVTENGRKNFDALSSVFNSFGKTLGDKINQGVLTAGQAAQQYREFARGIYGELTNLGVNTQSLSGIFRALGVDASGWTGNTQSVQQYAGFISAAAAAAGGLSDNLKIAEDYSKSLATALSSAFDRYYGLSSAVDKVRTAVNDLAKSYQDSINKVNELRKSNQGLAADLSTAQADQNKAQIEQAISIKYGETARAGDYGAQAATAGAKVADLQGQIDANNKEASALENGRNALDGYTTAAIDNRAALQSLQKVMLDQIAAYAAQGHTTQEVTAYTDDLQRQFVAAAQAAGYSAAQVQGYTGAFNNFATAIRNVPNRLNVTATADTGQALNALNAIPKSATHLTTTLVEPNNYAWTQTMLALIPKKADYVVTPRVDTGGVGGAIAAQGSAVGAAFGTAMSNTIKSVFADSFANFNMNTFFNNGINGLAPTKYMGGLIARDFGGIPGFAGGGRVPGTPPSDPNKDNMLAMGPGGIATIRSGEFVVRQQIVQQPGVLDFLSKLNNGEMQGYFAGGNVGNYSGTSGGMVEFSPEDRRLLLSLRQTPEIALYADGQRLAESTQQGNTRLANRGRG